MPSTIRHATLGGFLAMLLSLFAEARDLGLVVAVRVEMRLKWAARVPDIFFVARANFDRLSDERLTGGADLVIEVVSDDSVERDREEKFREYAEAGVAEYWIVDARPGHEEANFYHLGSDGAHQKIPPDADGRYRSAALPGFWFRPDWLWREPLPDALACFAAIAPDAVRAAIETAERADAL